MKAKDFFGKFVSAYLWGNLLAMFLVIVALAIGVKYGLAWYTHHGEGIEVPKIEGMSYADARLMIDEMGLNSSSATLVTTSVWRPTVFWRRTRDRV